MDANTTRTRETAVEDCRRRLLRRVQQLDDQLDVWGVVDRRGRLRQPWLTTLARLVEAVARLEGAGADQPAPTTPPALEQYLQATYKPEERDE